MNEYYNVEYSNFVSLVYRKYTPLIGGLYDVTHKNWHIAEGANYAHTIRTIYGDAVLAEVISNKDISIVSDKLRQDKKTNNYFWIGMKLAQKAKLARV